MCVQETLYSGQECSAYFFGKEAVDQKAAMSPMSTYVFSLIYQPQVAKKKSSTKQRRKTVQRTRELRLALGFRTESASEQVRVPAQRDHDKYTFEVVSQYCSIFKGVWSCIGNVNTRTRARAHTHTHTHLQACMNASYSDRSHEPQKKHQKKAIYFSFNTERNKLNKTGKRRPR